jgi:LacI family transcriptional regulator
VQPYQLIALVTWTDGSYCRGLVRGVRDYAKPAKPWIFRIVPPDAESLPLLAEWDPAGIVAFITSLDLAHGLKRLGKPVVNVSNSLSGLRFPRVGPDELAVGRLAAEHFLSNGLRNAGYMGNPADHFSRQRERGFRDAIRAAGCTYHSYREVTSHVPRGTWMTPEGVQKWLLGLPKPVGILAANDVRGWGLAEACLRTHITVPEEVAIMGVDDDDLACGLSHPPLSSVATGSQRIGYEAAALLDRLLTGEPAPTTAIVVPPVGVVVRQSTDSVAVKDADVVAALRFIRSHADQNIGVRKVLQEVPIARRSLEQRFRKALARTVGEEIRRVHVERAKGLLSRTELPIAEVARQAGFTSSKHLCTIFRRALGLVPTAYRRQCRARHL